MTAPSLPVLLFTLLLPGIVLAAGPGFPGPLKVTFRTTDCDGAIGMASVNADHVSRIQPYVCPNGFRLKQVLTRSGSGINEVYTITEDESVRLEAQIRQVMDTRRKALETTKPVIIER